MKIVQFDSVGGASGDMILAALLDLGAESESLQKALKTLPIEPFEIVVGKVTLQGITGTQISIRAAAHSHAAPHRGLKEIRAIVEGGHLPDIVKKTARDVFQRIAVAEGRVHNLPPESIHFHEIGAVDSIVDVVGCCLALDQLGVRDVAVRPLPLGHGTIRCAHGVLPSPAPATVELLKGFPVEAVDEPFELVTPTAAALLTAWRNSDGPPAGSRLAGAGYGFGQRMLRSRPNLLRALLFETADAATGADECLVMECNLDDMVPELIGALTQRLLDAGALDVFTTPIQMKKQRPGTLLTILCRPESRAKLQALVFTESTTFGLREYVARRTVLERESVEVGTPYGAVRVKLGKWKGAIVTRAPEYEDCRARAEAANVPVRVVYEAATAAIQAQSQQIRGNCSPAG